MYPRGESPSIPPDDLTLMTRRIRPWFRIRVGAGSHWGSTPGNAHLGMFGTADASRRRRTFRPYAEVASQVGHSV